MSYDACSFDPEPPAALDHIQTTATAMIAYATSRLVCEEGIYHALAQGFIERASSPPEGEKPRPSD